MSLFRKTRKMIKKYRKVQPDIYIVSYPKSGRTWLRFMLCRYLIEKYKIEKDVSLDLLEATKLSGLPLTNFTHHQSNMSLKLAYSEMVFNQERFGGKRVLFLGRDIKDTVVSAYHQATKRNIVFEGPISEFVKNEQFGVRKIIRFYQMWLENKTRPVEFAYLSYEQMHQDPSVVLKSALAFIGEKEIDESAVKNAVESGRFDNMRKIEQGVGSKSSSVLKPGDANDLNSFKTRKGLVGDYANELSEEDIQCIDSTIEEAGLKSLMAGL
jgi:hypothetical protein